MGVEYPSFEQCEKLFRLLRVEFIDVLGERTDCINALPPGDGIGAHDWMNCRQMGADILRCTTWSFVDNNMLRIGRSSFQEPIANESRCQALEEFVVWLGEAGRIVSRPYGRSTLAIVTYRSYSS
jgi:hypothetical protein